MELARDKLEKLTDRSTDIVVATDRKGTIVYYNDGAARSLGYSPKEMLGSFVGRLYPSIEEAKRVMEVMRGPEHGGPGIADAIQTQYVAKDGTEIPVAISGTILYSEPEPDSDVEAGQEDGSIGYAKDLREILHKDQLATLGEVAIGLSHEINNPLAVILNQTELLESEIYRLVGEGDSSVEIERLDAVRREVARVSEIIARLGEMVQADTYETIDYIGPAKMVDLRRQGDESGPDPKLKGLSVLVVDDDLGIRTTLREIIEGWGCVVQTAGDGDEALRCIEAGGVDLVLSDVVMPNMDGHELFLAVQESYPGLPVLMMTAFHYDKDHIIKRSRMKGVQGVIFKKPVDPAKLREVIGETVGR
jgi:PAS domain S-box-containing protein